GVHNRLSSAHQPGPWVYNANHQLLNHGEGTQAVSREYDANGHTRRIAANGGAEKRLSYDVAERLTQVESETGTPIGTYAYDPFGRRLKKTTASETIYFQHGEEGLLAEYDASGNSLTTYGWEPQGMWGTNPVWKKEASNTYFYSNDHLGTPQVLTDSSGQIVWKGRAEAFGKTTVDAASTVTNNLRFPGQYFDAETGMHYNYFRDYEPTIGRYVQSDPIGLRGGENPYRYAGANAIARIDAHGLYSGGVHEGITERALSGIQCSDFGGLPRAVKLVDTTPTIIESQQPRNAHWHAMCRRGESPLEGRNRMNNFINEQLRTCTFWGLAKALHAIQDSTAPAHSGCHEYDGSVDIGHIATDTYPPQRSLDEAEVRTAAMIRGFLQMCKCFCK
ncbi:MAG: hypothetical protein F9K47_17100, partial [Burkholderiales bacterium]